MRNLRANFLSAIPDDNDELQREITTLAGHINAANYRFLKLLAVLVDRGAWNGGGIKSPAHWLNYYCGISLGPAREKVRVALALAELPLIDAAFATGALSYSKVRAMTRVATPANEEYLLMIARHGTASHMETLVRKYQRVDRQSREDQDTVQRESRRISCYTDDDGMLVIRGRLAEHAVATAADGAVALAGGDKVQVVVHINADATANTQEPPGYIENGPALSATAVKRLADDASLVTVLEDGKGNVLNVGRKTRTIPPSIRRALTTRDGGCRFPGCCESKIVVPTIFITGATAVRRVSITWYCCAGAITVWCMKQGTALSWLMTARRYSAHRRARSCHRGGIPSFRPWRLKKFPRKLFSLKKTIADWGWPLMMQRPCRLVILLCRFQFRSALPQTPRPASPRE